jgi:hypothetical protein
VPCRERHWQAALLRPRTAFTLEVVHRQERFPRFSCWQWSASSPRLEFGVYAVFCGRPPRGGAPNATKWELVGRIWPGCRGASKSGQRVSKGGLVCEQTWNVPRPVFPALRVCSQQTQSPVAGAEARALRGRNPSAASSPIHGRSGRRLARRPGLAKSLPASAPKRKIHLAFSHPHSLALDSRR